MWSPRWQISCKMAEGQPKYLMFTGIITDLGSVESFDGKRLVVRTRFDTNEIHIGASVACSGVCLTLVDRAAGLMFFDVSAETISKTTLGDWQAGDAVNLERALKVGDELGGHFVSGHVDGVGEIIAITPDGTSMRVVVQPPAALMRFFVPKGSVTMDGVSLTVNDVTATNFGVNIIPHTRQVTKFGQYEPGDPVNIEVDMMARYVVGVV